MSRDRTEPRDAASGYESRSARARTSRRPLSSPTGAAPARQSFSPLYWGGLWLAVMDTAGTSREPDAKYTRSVDVGPRSTTSAPRDVTPSVSAAASEGDEGRTSRPTATLGAPDHSANAAPMRRATSSSS